MTPVNPMVATAITAILLLLGATVLIALIGAVSYLLGGEDTDDPQGQGDDND